MLKPEFLKISMDIAEGIDRRIELLHNSGVSYAELWADFFNNSQLFENDSFDDATQEEFSFQYDAATFVVLAAHLADAYMELQEGWDRRADKWIKKELPAPPVEQEC